MGAVRISDISLYTNSLSHKISKINIYRIITSMEINLTSLATLQSCTCRLRVSTRLRLTGPLHCKAARKQLQLCKTVANLPNRFCTDRRAALQGRSTVWLKPRNCRYQAKHLLLFLTDCETKSFVATVWADSGCQKVSINVLCWKILRHTVWTRGAPDWLTRPSWNIRHTLNRFTNNIRAQTEMLQYKYVK